MKCRTVQPFYSVADPVKMCSETFLKLLLFEMMLLTRYSVGVTVVVDIFFSNPVSLFSLNANDMVAFKMIMV